jgi:hypothetical protein
MVNVFQFFDIQSFFNHLSSKGVTCGIAAIIKFYLFVFASASYGSWNYAIMLVHNFA